MGPILKKNPKEECKAIITKSKRETMVEDEGRMSDEKELVAEREKEKEEDQIREKKNDEEKEEKK